MRMPIITTHCRRSWNDFRSAGSTSRQSCLKTSHRVWRLLRETIEEAGIPIETLKMGDRLLADDAVEIEVLHPPRRGVIGSDNANSVVLAIEYQGHRVLLPGDLEPPGLQYVLSERPLDCTLLLAPHHGSTTMDPSKILGWSTPEWVVISGGRRPAVESAIEGYRSQGTHVFHTQLDGAVQSSITEAGQFEIRCWVQNRWERVNPSTNHASSH